MEIRRLSHREIAKTPHNSGYSTFPGSISSQVPFAKEKTIGSIIPIRVGSLVLNTAQYNNLLPVHGRARRTKLLHKSNFGFTSISSGFASLIAIRHIHSGFRTGHAFTITEH
jgi:hypothetical protein